MTPTAGISAAGIGLNMGVGRILDMNRTLGRRIYFSVGACPWHDGPMFHSTGWLAILFVLLWNSGFISAE